eukprot:GSChrysophyteH1.ASY1.ANO1.2520.1 assembled CDS
MCSVHTAGEQPTTWYASLLLVTFPLLLLDVSGVFLFTPNQFIFYFLQAV